MKKIVFKFWIINFLISVALFFIYNMVIAATKTVDGNLFEKLIQILELLLNMGFAFIYFIAMAISSFVLLLNLVEKIRNNFYLSLSTFLGIPLFCFILIISNVLIDIRLHNFTILTTLAIFSTIGLLLTTIQFLLFRKRINKIQVQ
ncbi:hypothetical protein NJT12_10380 [Flavobacterium sp. AC]|uniref:Uncharacterized protein n=1 Tax=Flavobacterium azizsancarii TaxID=2961580 RepID=A0ABT4WBR5_9FLAO|nr:hypothetical protein [Flavobacterium azizsancarii]MDA6070023.1 hypothetical protein [Flavobacterium azizsancarii]